MGLRLHPLAVLVAVGGCNLVLGIDDRAGRDGGGGAAAAGTANGGASGAGGGETVGGAGGAGGASVAGGAGNPCTNLPMKKRVFLTSQSFQTGGDFVNVAGADGLCMAYAANASPPLQGIFRAWLSVPGASAPNHLGSDGPWCDCNDQLVASDLADLLDGELRQNIDRDESCMVHAEFVWTGTAPDGVPSFEHCTSWTSVSSTVVGLVGRSDELGTLWTSSATRPCDQPAHFYCFEQ